MPERIYTTPLPNKLGVIPSKAGPMHVALIVPPPELVDLLGDLPATTTFTAKLTPTTNLALCFIRSRAELPGVVDLLVAQLPKSGSAWIIYPKARLKPGFNENDVRDAALAAGLVDYKVCSVSENWSALKFAHRKPTTK